MTEGLEVLKFSATWCSPCRHLAQILEGVENITAIDIDSQPEIAREHGVRSVPLLLFKVNGKEVHRHVGLLSKDKYLSLITEIHSSKELWED
jgi:thioredoxin 1